MTEAHKKNFGLSEDDFVNLVAALRRGDEGLFERTFLSHFAECLRYVKNNDGASHDQAYDATMEAFLTFRNKIAEGKITYGNLRYLLTRMARQHHYKLQKKQSVVAGIAEEHQELPEPEVVFDPDTRAVLDVAWKQLGLPCRRLLRKVYYQHASMQDIAVQEGANPATLRKRKERCVRQLREIFMLAQS